MSAGFDLRFLQAVSDWQRGGDERQNRRRGEKLKEVCANLPKKYRACALCCFRQVALPKGGVWDLIGENSLPEKISSWTVDVEVAKRFKNGVPPEGQGHQGVILCIYPPPDSIIVNLRELYNEPAFITALEQGKDAITGYHDGAGRYGNNQSEVVLEITAITQKDIYSMGGYSSPFEQLLDVAAKQIYGPRVTLDQREALLLHAEHVRSEAGPRWLDHEATQRVLSRMTPHAEWLGEIKRLQEEGC